MMRLSVRKASPSPCPLREKEESPEMQVREEVAGCGDQ
jgi:hypothetical protein